MDAKAVHNKFTAWRQDWCLFAREVFKVSLDSEQEAILRSVQHNKMTSVASGTARGKDFISAVAALCFLYLTPKWNSKGELVENTKVALTAPTDRQVGNIMVPEFARLFSRAGFLPGRLTGYDIRTDDKEWFLTGFKADEHRHEAWSGFHAVNTMFVVTEASGINEGTFHAIEGNLQGNSRLLIVFNPNISTGYAAASQKSPRFHKFRLDSLNAPNVLQKANIIPGQVDYEWVADKVQTWCEVIAPEDVIEAEGDVEWEGHWYRPNDLFRVKVRGMFPKVGSDVLVPQDWIEAAMERWRKYKRPEDDRTPLRLGVDVAGMGRDSSAFCHRYGNYVEKIRLIQSGGTANHMEIAGITRSEIAAATNTFRGLYPQAFIDTVGEGAGVYSRLLELNVKEVHSVKGGAAAKDGSGRPYKDITGIYQFKNLRAYLYWAVRDWLNPRNGHNAMLPPGPDYRGLTELRWNMLSDGSIELESKEDLKKRTGKSPDEEDSLAMTFYPVADIDATLKSKRLKHFYPI